MPKYLPSPEAGSEKAWLRIREAALRLGVTEKTVRRWLKAGKLRWKMLQGPNGPEYRVDPEDIRSLSEQIAVFSPHGSPDELTQKHQSTLGLTSTNQSLQELIIHWTEFMKIMASQSAILESVAETLQQVVEELRSVRELLEKPPERPPWWRRWWRWRRAKRAAADEDVGKPEGESPEGQR